MQRSPSEDESSDDSAMQINTNAQERRQRLLRILALFDPKQAKPDHLQQQIQDRQAGETENVNDFVARYYAALCVTVLEAGEQNAGFYNRVNVIVPESFCAIDAIRKEMDDAFEAHYSPPPGVVETTSDELDRTLRDYIRRIGNASRTPRIDKIAAIYAVAALLCIFSKLASRHTVSYPSCNIYQDILNMIINELEAFPEDVFPANLDTIDDILRMLDEHDDLYELSSRLEYLVRFLTGARGKRRVTGSSAAGGSKRPGSGR